MSKDYKQILKDYVPKRISQFMVNLMGFATGLFCKNKQVKYVYDFDIKTLKNKQFILASDHASRNNFYFVINGLKGFRLNSIVGHQNFFDKSLFNLFLKTGSIPKKYMFMI